MSNLHVEKQLSTRKLKRILLKAYRKSWKYERKVRNFEANYTSLLDRGRIQRDLSWWSGLVRDSQEELKRRGHFG